MWDRAVLAVCGCVPLRPPLLRQCFAVPGMCESDAKTTRAIPSLSMYYSSVWRCGKQAAYSTQPSGCQSCPALSDRHNAKQGWRKPRLKTPCKCRSGTTNRLHAAALRWSMERLGPLGAATTVASTRHWSSHVPRSAKATACSSSRDRHDASYATCRSGTCKARNIQSAHSGNHCTGAVNCGSVRVPSILVTERSTSGGGNTAPAALKWAFSCLYDDKRKG